MNWYDNFQLALFIAIAPASIAVFAGPLLGDLLRGYRRLSAVLHYGGVAVCGVEYSLCIMCAVYNTYFM